MITGHGGNVQALAQQNGCGVEDIMDMSSNINPLGPPGGFEAFIRDNVHQIRSLPQADAQAMVQAFGTCYGVDEARVMGGNGTTWFIYTLPLALAWQRVVISGPTYADYRDGCAMHGVACDFSLSVPENGFKPDLSRLSDMAAGADAVIICNPNNPTGTLTDVRGILALAEKHPRTWVVVDESYLPFVAGAESMSLVAETRHPNLIVLSSMSKIFRIPGLRTGFLCADPQVIERMTHYDQPWSVNALSQAAVGHILGQPEKISTFLAETRRFVEKERRAFESAMADVPGITLYPSEAYFMLAELKNQMTSDAVCRQVGRERILIRDCANFHGLSQRFVRFSLRDRETNLLLARILKKVLR